METNHVKHAKLKKPQIGFFGRNEFAFLGANCTVINNTIHTLVKQLDKNLNVCFVDADHTDEETEILENRINVLQDNIAYKTLKLNNLNAYDQKFHLANQDLILINGNHFQANTQIVFLYPEKESSLKKRIEQLTNIKAFVLKDSQSIVYDWLKKYVVDFEKIPQILISETDKLAQIISKNCIVPPLKGLVLIGGKSSRMGEDKSLIEYHDKPQKEYLLKQFNELNIGAFLSVAVHENEATNNILDKFIGLGPYGAILSAFQTEPDTAWLVIACDLPHVTKSEIAYLVSKRNPNKLATAFYNSETEFPDPLFTIWEPKAYISLLNYLMLGYSCPRKVLINSDIEIITLADPLVLQNANSPKDKTLFLEQKNKK